MLRGGFRPWSQTMVSERARPWGRGRSGNCEVRKRVTRNDKAPKNFATHEMEDPLATPPREGQQWGRFREAFKLGSL